MLDPLPLPAIQSFIVKTSPGMWDMKYREQMKKTKEIKAKLFGCLEIAQDKVQAVHDYTGECRARSWISTRVVGAD